MDDLVSRQWLLDEYDRRHEGPPGGARKIIEEAPAVEPIRKKGKWKRTYLDHEAMGERPSIFYCSVCGQCIAYHVNFLSKLRGGHAKGDR